MRFIDEVVVWVSDDPYRLTIGGVAEDAVHRSCRSSINAFRRFQWHLLPHRYAHVGLRADPGTPVVSVLLSHRRTQFKSCGPSGSCHTAVVIVVIVGPIAPISCYSVRGLKETHRLLVTAGTVVSKRRTPVLVVPSTGLGPSSIIMLLHRST
jgi:hypothetical protein